MFLLRFKQFWERVPDGKFVRIARVNPGDERVNRAVQKFLVQTAQHKFGDTFFHAVAARRHERFAREGEFRAGGKKFRRQKFRLRRRHRHRFLVADDVAVFCVGTGINPARFEAQVADEFGNFRRRFEDRVRAGLGEKAILPRRLDDAAGARARFISRDRHAFALQIKRGGQPRDASADDRDGFHSSSEKLNHAAALSRTLVFSRL